MPTPTTPRARRSPARLDAATVAPRIRDDDNNAVPASKKGLDLGESHGDFDDARVRQKIRQWQTQGGGVVKAPDPLADYESEGDGAPRSKNSGDPSGRRIRSSTPSSAPGSANKIDYKRQAWTRRPARVRIDTDVRNAIAPKARVVSDEHWMKARSPDVKKRDALKETLSPNDKIHHESLPKRLGKEKNEPCLGVKGGSSAPATPTKQTRLDDGIRVYSITRSRETTPTNPDSNVKMQRDSSRALTERHIDTSRANLMPSTYSTWKSPHDDAHEDSEKPALASSRKPGDRVGSHSPTVVTPEKTQKKLPRESQSRRTSRSRLSDQPGRHVDEEPADVPPKPHGSRIEAWLTGTSDPFIEDGRAVTAPRSELDLSHKERRRSKSRYSSMELHDSEPRLEEGRSHDMLERRGSTSRGRSAHDVSARSAYDFRKADGGLASTTYPTAAEERPEMLRNITSFASPSLKRNGARRNMQSPSKRRARDGESQDHLSQGEEDSAASSSVDGSTFEVPEVDLKKYSPTPFMKKPFPTTGKRLSTIASVETFSTRHRADQNTPPLRPDPPSIVSEDTQETAQAPRVSIEAPSSEAGDEFDPHSLSMYSDRKTHTKGKLARHEDLISVLSMPADNRSIRSARSIRTSRTRLATATIGDVMEELSADETKYMRELRTLVDGVIPVLLTCVLSKSDAATAAGLFSKNVTVKDDTQLTKPIIDMGVALERLKSLHKRVSTRNPGAFLLWAQSASKAYEEYLKAWKLGFQDVVVNLAPAEDGETAPRTSDDWANGLPRNEDGDVVDGDGERVDVAFLLKRPLVRLKYLAKTLKGINLLQPSEQAESLAAKYQNLVVEARKRSNEERARLEDEAAASIDPTRAREPRTLAPLAGVSIDPSRCVKARDYFDMSLLHSSGQRVDCRVELLCRDDPPDEGLGGDLLICEVDNTGRWLFFPPIQKNRVSCRAGDSRGQIVIMLRGLHNGGMEWRELMLLSCSDEQTASEWTDMLSLQPVPPELPELVFPDNRPRVANSSDAFMMSGALPTATEKGGAPTPGEVAVPIGEAVEEASMKWIRDIPKSSPRRTKYSESTSEGNSPTTQTSCRVQRKPVHSANSSPLAAGTASRTTKIDQSSAARLSDLSTATSSTPRELNGVAATSNRTADPAVPRSSIKTLSGNGNHPGMYQLDVRSEPNSPRGRASSRDPVSSETPRSPTASTISRSSQAFSVWMPSSLGMDDVPSDEEDEENEKSGLQPSKSAAQHHRPASPPQRPAMTSRTSSVPSKNMPTINKLRKDPEAQNSEDTQTHKLDSFKTPVKAKQEPAKLSKSSSKSALKSKASKDSVKPPPPPPHRSQPLRLRNSRATTFAAGKNRRRSSSPLKHEYEPSTATESSSDSETSAHGDDSATSDSEDAAVRSSATSLIHPIDAIMKPNTATPPETIFSGGKSTLTPSQSASQVPFRKVPHQEGAKAAKAIASIFSWSEKGMWEALHPRECSVVVTPGLIEAFEMNSSHSSPLRPDSSTKSRGTNPADQPLVGLELTPLVPLRRGTAVDISIRSPPTENSKIRTTNNIMFRSRNPEECEALYAMINQSRINNPTYVALQKARGPSGQSNWAAVMDQRNNLRVGGGGDGWFGLGRKSSYRASANRVSGMHSSRSESSVSTMNTALSALRRFSAGNKVFNIARSTIISHVGGSRSTTSISSSVGTGSGSGTSTPAILDPSQGTPVGISNTKIRLYQRESASKWRDMGSARLTIMHPPRGTRRVSINKQDAGQPGQEKRIIITGKTNNDTLLDVTLGESCFERVARTGIAVSCWEESELVGHTGGVGATRAKVYMIQMKNEAETAYTFSLVGKLRY